MQFGARISILYRNRQQHIKKRLVGTDITISDYPVVIVLYLEPGATCNQIYDEYFIPKSAVSKSTAKLQKLGFATCEPDETHKQKSKYFLTEKGLKLADELLAITEEWEAQVTKGFTEEEFEQVVEVTKKMRGNISHTE